MARPARKIELSVETKTQLEKNVSCRTIPAWLQKRSKIILQCAEGIKHFDIAKENGISETTVISWKNRFLEHGITGLKDARRSGRPPIYGEKFKADILAKLEETPPNGYSRWDGNLLAQATGYSKDAIWKFLRTQRICLARKRSWCVSTDPLFAVKAADIVGLYLAPPENALVICVDEKPNIQALEREVGYVVSSNKKLIRGLESTYKRNGTLNLFAALEVATGLIHSKATEPTHKNKKGFLAFMEELLLELPERGEYHVIMDNHSIHKNHDQWLAEHPNVFFHYTPTSASWLNMVEIWFGILTCKSLKGASFNSTDSLAEHIKCFQKAYNETAKPFVWRKREVRGAQIKNSLSNFYN